MPKITYGGPTSRDDISTEFIVREPTEDGRRGKPVRMRKGLPIEVSDKLAAMLTGEDAPKGHKFELVNDDETVDEALATLKESEAKNESADAETTTEARPGARRGASR